MNISHMMQESRQDVKEQSEAIPSLDIRHSKFEIGNSNKLFNDY